MSIPYSVQSAAEAYCHARGWAGGFADMQRAYAAVSRDPLHREAVAEFTGRRYVLSQRATTEEVHARALAHIDAHGQNPNDPRAYMEATAAVLRADPALAKAYSQTERTAYHGGEVARGPWQATPEAELKRENEALRREVQIERRKAFAREVDRYLEAHPETDYAAAMRAVAKENPELAREYAAA